MFKIMPLRQIAYTIRNTVKKELEKMGKLNVIEKIREPTPVISAMHIVKKTIILEYAWIQRI